MEELSLTERLNLGFGRVVRNIRKTKKQTQRQVAAGTGLSYMTVQKIESEKNGKGVALGFTSDSFARVCVYFQIEPDRMMEKIMAAGEIGTKKDMPGMNRSRGFQPFIEDESSRLLHETSKRNGPQGESLLTWLLRMAAFLGHLPQKEQAEVGLEILKLSASQGLIEQEHAVEEMQRLFERTIRRY